MSLPPPIIFSTHPPFEYTVERPNHKSASYISSLTRHIYTPVSVYKRAGKLGSASRLAWLRVPRFPLRKAASFLLANITLLFTRFNTDGKELGYQRHTVSKNSGWKTQLRKTIVIGTVFAVAAPLFCKKALLYKGSLGCRAASL